MTPLSLAVFLFLDSLLILFFPLFYTLYGAPHLDVMPEKEEDTMSDNAHKLISMHIVNLSNYLLRQVGRSGAVRALDGKGGVYDDDVATYHLCELLLRLDGYRYREYIDQMLTYYRKSSASHQNPFMVNSLVIAGHADSEFVSEAVADLLSKGRLPSNLFSMYTAYLGGGDHFSTLV